MRIRRFDPALAVTLLLGAALAGQSVAVEVQPGVLDREAGPRATVRLAFNPDRMQPTPRSEILDVLWWCWMPDPMPQECSEPRCDSPRPYDPICGTKVRETRDKLVYEFNTKALVEKAGDACGEVPFAVRAKFANGTISETKGKAEIACREK